MSPNSLKTPKLKSYLNSDIIYGGYISDIKPKIIDSSVIILPSYREGFSRVLMEAQACSRAVITSNVAGCRDAIVNNETGYLIPFKDKMLLHAKIEYLIKNKQEIYRMSKNARRYAEINFDVDSISKMHLDELLKNIAIN